MNYKTERTFIQEYMDKKEDLLNELGKYLYDRYDTEVKVIAVETTISINHEIVYYLYFYINSTMKVFIYGANYDINEYNDIYHIFKKYGFINIERYISNTILPKRKTIINKDDNSRLETYVYAMTNDSILYVNNGIMIFDNTDNIEIDYTDDNFNVIDEL